MISRIRRWALIDVTFDHVARFCYFCSLSEAAEPYRVMHEGDAYLTTVCYDCLWRDPEALWNHYVESQEIYQRYVGHGDHWIVPVTLTLRKHFFEIPVGQKHLYYMDNDTDACVIDRADFHYAEAWQGD